MAEYLLTEEEKSMGTPSFSDIINEVTRGLMNQDPGPLIAVVLIVGFLGYLFLKK